MRPILPAALAPPCLTRPHLIRPHPIRPHPFLPGFRALLLIATCGAFATVAGADDGDLNGIDDADEQLLARRFCPSIQLHGPETALNGLTTPVYPVPVAVMGLANAQPGEGLPADRLFVEWRQHPLGYPYADHWVAATGWNPPLPESSPARNYATLVDDPAELRHALAPPGMPSGPYWLRFHWEYGNPAVDEPHEWYAVWQHGNEWARPGRTFPPTIYAHLFRCDLEGCDFESQVAPTEVVIQYWFFFPFNDWVNNHEGDWEGIQVGLSSASPAEAAITEVETFAHRYYIARDPVHYPSLAEHVLIVDDTHPVVFIGGHGYKEGCIGGVGYGEGSHGCYPSFGRWQDVGEGDLLGCFTPADDVIAHTAGPYLHWRDIAIEIIPDPDAPNLDFDVEPERAWLAADLRWGTRRVPSVGGNIVTDAGNWAPHGPVHNTEQRWNRTARGATSKPFVTIDLPRARPYHPVGATGWVPFALFLDTFTGETEQQPSTLDGWTLGTGSWQVVMGALDGIGNGSRTTTNRATFYFERRPLWYDLPWVEMNPRLTRLACDVAAAGVVPDSTQIGVVVQSGAKDSDPVRVVWWRVGDTWEIRVVSTRDSGATYEVHGAAPVAPLTTHWQRLEIVTLDRHGMAMAFHDVYVDGELLLSSVMTLACGDDSRALVADGSANARFDRVAVSYARLAADDRHAPFGAWTQAPAAGDTLAPGCLQLAWLAVDEKLDEGIVSQRLDHSTDGGVSWEVIDNLDGHARDYSWLPPVPVEPLTLLLRLIIVDLDGDTRALVTGPFLLMPEPVGIRGRSEAWPGEATPDPANGDAAARGPTLTLCGQPAGSGAAGAAALTLIFTLPRAAPVRLAILGVDGRLVRCLVDRPYLSRGTHGIRWDLRHEGGARVPGGVYFCRLDAGGELRVKKTQIIW